MRKILALVCAVLIATAPALAQFRAYGTNTIQSGDTVGNTTSTTVLATRYLMGPTDSSGSGSGGDVAQGRMFQVDAYCTINTLGSSQGTLKFDIDWQNGNNGATLTVLGTTGAITPPASLATNTNLLWVHGFATFNTAGTSAVASFFGAMEIEGSSNAVTMYPMIPATMGTGGTSGWATSFNLTVDRINGIAVAVTWGTQSSSNTVTCATFVERVA